MPGKTEIRFYQADSAEIHLVRQQPESAILSIDGSPNTIPAGPATSPFWAEVGRGAREYGLKPRVVRGQWLPGQAPAGYDECGEFEVVIYSTAVYNAATIGAPLTYQGGSAKIVGKTNEDIYPGI